MTKTVLITRPNHEITTSYLFYWSEKIIQACNQSGDKLIDLRGKRANKKEVESIAQKTKPNLFIFNGHGNEKTVTGFDNEPIITAGENDQLLCLGILFIRACRCAIKLGPACIKHGARAFIGYTDDFVFPVDEQYITKPLLDRDAGIFLEASNQVAIALIKGHTSSESDEKSKNLFKKAINEFSSSDAPRDQASLVPFLLWDYQHQVCLGDQKATV